MELPTTNPPSHFGFRVILENTKNKPPFYSSYTPNFILTENWLLQAGYGYLYARYTELDSQVIGSFGTLIVNPLTLENAFVNAPEHSFSLGTEYSQHLDEYGSLIWRLDVSPRSEWANDALNTPEPVQDGVTLFNARLSFRPVNDNWETTVFGNNLSDEENIYAGAADKQNFGTAVAHAAPPREAGMVIRYRF